LHGSPQLGLQEDYIQIFLLKIQTKIYVCEFTKSTYKFQGLFVVKTPVLKISD
jgi:hypothetical protein